MNTSSRVKAEHPAKEFSNPDEVVSDPTLSTNEKRRVLSSLEQDAQQLAVASSEGMGDGEPTQLHDVLQAERSLEAASAENAFAVVLRTFEDQLQRTAGTDTHVVITRAIDAINAARAAIAGRARMPVPPPGAPKPGSPQELQEELDKEKLDPGA